jgi:hypothetical protein
MLTARELKKESLIKRPKKILGEMFHTGEYAYYKIGDIYNRQDLDKNVTTIKHSCYYRHKKKVLDAQK